MISERTADAGTDDGREPKDGAKCAKESWAVLKTGNLLMICIMKTTILIPHLKGKYHKGTHTCQWHPSR